MSESSNALADLLIGAVSSSLRKPTTDDFQNSEGITYCGTCGEPMEKIISLPFPGMKHRTVRIMCRCEREQFDEDERQKSIERDNEIIRNLRGMSLMDRKFLGSTFDTFEVTQDNAKQLKICRRYVAVFGTMLEKNQGLLLWGPPGTGKTFAAACIANALIELKVPVMMTSFVKLLSEAQTTSNNNGDESIIQKMNHAKLLIIDDLGAERGTPYGLEKVYNFIDSRYRAKLPVILTTNLTLQEMQSTTDIRYARIFDRVFETCFPVEFKGESRRFMEAARRYDEMEKLLGGD